MPTRRAILGQLSRDALLGVLDAYELAVPDRRVRDQHDRRVKTDIVEGLGGFPAAGEPRRRVEEGQRRVHVSLTDPRKTAADPCLIRFSTTPS
jgi:hypothetical protein